MPNKYLDHFTISIRGTNVSEDFYRDLVEVVVDSSLHMPSMFTVKLRDPDLIWVDSDIIDIGQEVVIEASLDAETEASASTGTLIKGEITAIEPLFSSEGQTCLRVRGYDKSHRLHLGRKTKTYLNIKDSDIVSKVAQESGLQSEVEQTPTEYPYVIQYNQTNMEFLLSRAELIGYRVDCVDGKLIFNKNSSLPSSGGVTLKYAVNLLSFEPRWTTGHKANQVTTRAWDPVKKEVIVSQKSTGAALAQGGLGKAPGSVVQSKFSQAAEIVVAMPAVNGNSAGEIAQGRMDDLDLEFVQAEGKCLGDPGVLAGKKIAIEGIGTRFSGSYFVTSAMHVYNWEGYRTHFTISGRHPQTLSRLLTGSGNGAGDASVQGVVTGIVTNQADPKDLGRVKIKFPWLGDEIESDWVRIAVPMAGPERGLMFLPEVNDEVLVAFEHGDPNRPYIIGMLWNEKDKPPYQNSEAAEGGKVNKRILKTRAGHMLEFVDKAGEELVTIKTKAGHVITMDDKKGSEKLSLVDKGGNSLVIDSAKNSMTIDVKGDFNVTSKGKINLSSTGNIDIAASGGNATLKGIKLGLEGTASGELKAPTVKVNGSGMAELTSGGIVQVQGSLVKIN
jgi:phage protein D